MITPNPDNIDDKDYDFEGYTMESMAYLYNPIKPSHYIGRTNILINQYKKEIELNDRSILTSLILSDCLSNLKKCIDYYLNVILDYFGLLYQFAPLGYKLEVLKYMNIIPSETISEIVKVRNDMEHEHNLLEEENIKRYLEIVQFVHSSFKRYLELFVCSGAITRKDDLNDSFKIEYDSSEHVFNIEIYNGEDDMKIGENEFSEENKLESSVEAQTIIPLLPPISVVHVFIKKESFYPPRKIKKDVKKFDEKEIEYLKWCGLLMRFQ